MNTPPPDPPPNPNRAPEYAWKTARRSVLAEWRRVDLHGAEKAWKDRARGAGQLVRGVLEKLRLEQRQAETEIVKVWNRLQDPNVAAHAQPVGLKHGTLFVVVDSNVWLAELVRYRSGEILQRMQSAFGSQLIRKLSFRM